MNRGFWAVVGAFVLWGMLPVYLKALSTVQPAQITAHRLVWCCLLVLGILAVSGRLGAVKAALVQPSTRWRLAVSGILIGVNWFVYAWAVEADRVVEASLGYFINPLVNVLFGVWFLRERLTRPQWLAVAIAAAGVTWLGVSEGNPPWIALILAVSFGAYGLIRKTTPVDSIPGLATETLLIAPFGVALLVYWQLHGNGALGQQSFKIDVLLIGAGLVTAIPLSLFSYGARRIRYSTVGIIQYLGPSMQLMLGVLVYHEPFGSARQIGFALIWMSLALYSLDGLRRRAPKPVPEF